MSSVAIKKKASGKKPSLLLRNKALLEKAYLDFNRSEFLHTDPVRCLHRYTQAVDQEVIGLMSAAFAYGSAKVFCPRLDSLFELLGNSPYQSIRGASLENLAARLPGYRFFRPADVLQMLKSLRSFFDQHQSLGLFFEQNWQGDIQLGLQRMRDELYGTDTHTPHSYGFKYWLPNPQAGSAKRLHLFLRWMVRKDDIDLGLWNFVPKSQLLIPLDTHLHNISKKLHFTHRRVADLKAVLEITASLKKIDPEDPIRFDFALCRIGMLNRKLRAQA